MRTFFLTTGPKNQEGNPDQHEPKVLLLGTHGKKELAGKAALRKQSELEKPPEDPDEQGMLNYIKN